jgi:hypothetical protein
MDKEQGRKVNDPLVVDTMSIESIDRELFHILFINQKVWKKDVQVASM